MKRIQISRRQLLATAAASTLLLAMGGVESMAQGKRVIRIAESDAGQADPYRAVTTQSAILMLNIYDYLVRVGPGGEIVPAIAESWTISEDGKSYTFKINANAKFHNGSPIRGEDVVFSLKRMVTMNRGFAYLFAVVDDVSAADGEATFVLKEAYSPFLSSLVRLAIISETQVMSNLEDGDFGEFKDYGAAYLSRAGAGSGPYRLAQHDVHSRSILELNPDYIGYVAPNPAEEVHLIYKVVPATIRQTMPRGEIDLTRLAMAREVITSLGRVDGVSLGNDVPGAVYQIKMHAQKAPLDDVNVRKAIALAFDYEALYQLLEVGDLRQGLPARGPIPSNVLGHDPAVEPIKRDIEAAKAAYAQSKYAGQTFELELGWSEAVTIQERFALLLQANLAELGLTLKITPMPFPLLAERATNVDTSPHFAIINSVLMTPDIDSMLWGEYHSSAPRTYMNMHWLSGNELDAELELGRTTLDPSERATVYSALAKKIADRYPALFLYNVSNVIAFRSVLSAPGFQDPPAYAVPMLGGNFQFNKLSVNG